MLKVVSDNTLQKQIHDLELQGKLALKNLQAKRKELSKE